MSICLFPASMGHLMATDPGPEIFADWAKRQKAYKSLRITTEGSVLFTPNHLNGSQPEGKFKSSVTKPESFTLLIDCETGRVRYELKTFLPSGPDLSPRQFNRSFVMQKDQVIAKYQRAENAIPGDDSDRYRPDLSFMKLEHSEFPTIEVMPILWSLGRVSLPNRELRGRKIWTDIEYDASLFDSIATESPSVVRLKSTPITSGPSAIYSEFTLNPKMQYAVKSMRLNSPGMGMDYQIKNYDKDHPNLPTEWSCSLRHQNNLIRMHQHKVTSIEINPPVKNNDFDFPLEPGQLVSMHGKTQRVSPDGKLVDLVGEEAEREKRRQNLAQQAIVRPTALPPKEDDKAQSSLLMIGGLCAFGIVAGVGIILIFRRRMGS